MSGTKEASSDNASATGRDLELNGKPSLEAVEIAAGAGNITLDEETNRRIVRMIDWKLMPVVRISSQTRIHPILVNRS